MLSYNPPLYTVIAHNFRERVKTAINIDYSLLFLSPIHLVTLNTPQTIPLPISPNTFSFFSTVILPSAEGLPIYYTFPHSTPLCLTPVYTVHATILRCCISKNTQRPVSFRFFELSLLLISSRTLSKLCELSSH